MLKNKLNYKLINTLLVVLVIYLMYHTGNLWIGIFKKLGAITFPFFISFVVAYALYPFLKWMMDHKIKKGFALAIILLIIFGVLAFLVWMVVPLLVDQLVSLFNSILAFTNEMSNKFDFNVLSLQKVLDNSFDSIVGSVGNYVSNGAIKAINVSLSYITLILISFSAAIYFLLDMDKIRESVKEGLKKKSMKAYRYVAILDKEMKSYLSGMIKVMGITLVEYSLAYMIIGHPNALLLGLLATIGVLIPYFGGIMTNIVAAITAFVVSPILFIKTCITFVLLSGVDGYLINPYVYGKTNNVHPLIVIFSVFAGGLLFGIIGIMISFPMAVIIISTYKYFKDDISDKIHDKKKFGRRKK